MTAPFIKLAGVNTNADTPAELSEKNIPINLARGFPQLRNMPEIAKMKGDVPIAVVGGGPSAKNFVEDIRKYRWVIVAGSAHDWVMDQGIIPRYAAFCDPDPLMAKYIARPCKETTYLVSTHSPPEVFEALKDHSIALWHCLPTRVEFLNEVDPGWSGVSGGCTIGLRSINIAIMLGFFNLHLFGFDSCLGSNKEHHAYEFATDKEELGTIYAVKEGMGLKGPAEETFYCAGYQLAQASHYREFLVNFSHLCNIEVFGEGLIPSMHRRIMTRAAELKKEHENV